MGINRRTCGKCRSKSAKKILKEREKKLENQFFDRKAKAELTLTSALSPAVTPPEDTPILPDLTGA